MEQKHAKQNRRDARKKSLPVWGRILLAIGALALLAVIAIAVLGLGLLNRVSRTETVPAAAPALTATPAATAAPTLAPAAAPTPTAAPTPEPTPLPLEEVCEQTLLTAEQYAKMEENNADANFRNVLLIGIDRRGNSGNASADTMMIATLDKKNGRLKLTSLLRDMLVQIPATADREAAYDKINSAASRGGVALLMQTINENFRLNLQEYVLVDFQMFMDIIDKMGGITVRMSAAEISAANDCIAGLNKQWGVDYLWDGFIFAEGGNVLCTGKQALGYARVRHLDSDFQRTNRQYKVLTAVYAKFRSLSATKQYAILYDLLPLVETNMGNEAILECGLGALSMDTGGILQSRVPADDTYQSGRYNRKAVLLTDITRNALLLHQFIYENADAAEPAQVLTPGASLPPRTPSPTYGVPDANGNMIYYYADGTLVPGQNLVDQNGVPIDGSLVEAVPPDTVLPGATPTPWQSVGDGLAEG